ncbi:MAG: NlpC/P60 family protein [Pseudomonadota bacterium]
MSNTPDPQDTLDPRLNAYRPDLADARLQNQVPADRYVDGHVMRVRVAVANLLRSPHADGGVQAQAIFGHDMLVFETAKNDDGQEWSWCQTASDGYVGYVRSDALSPRANPATHFITVPRSFVYCQADLKSRRTACLSMGSHVAISDYETVRGTRYAILESGEALFANHLAPLGAWQHDPVAVAETLLHTPYLWGGNTGLGIDCSGLVQLAMACCGRTVLRDSDMQARSIGLQLEGGSTDLQRGDLVFWSGHVGMMVDSQTLIHANAHTMTVALEPLKEAIDRINYLYGQPTSYRRP